MASTIHLYARKLTRLSAIAQRELPVLALQMRSLSSRLSLVIVLWIRIPSFLSSPIFLTKMKSQSRRVPGGAAVKM